jgi:hypothetical protein
MEINKLIDSLKIEDLKNLNKKRGLSTSGNRSILIDILKKYEKAEYVKISPVVSQKYLNKTTTSNKMIQKNITPIQQFDNLKLADIRKLNKERDLPTSGNKALLIEFLKNFEKKQHYIKIAANNETFIKKINNVHNFELTAVKNIAKKIISENPAQYERPKYAPNFFDMIEKVKVDFFDFNGIDLFASICQYINNHKYGKEMYKRLMEEIKEAEGTCTVGHITRLINSIRGFENDEFSATVSDYSFYESEKLRVFHFLNKELADLFEDFTIDNFEIIINSGKINFPSNLQITLQIFKDYSKINWSVDQTGKFIKI